MIKRETLRTWLPVLAAALIVIAAFVTGALDKQQVWGDMVFYEQKYDRGQSIKAADGYGQMNTGPGYTLPAGKYRLKWIIDTDGLNRFVFHTANGARIVPEQVEFGEGSAFGGSSWEHTIDVEILDTAEEFEIRTMFEDGTYINVLEYRLYSPFYKDDAVTLACWALALSCLWVMYRRGRLTPARCGRLLLMGFAVMLVCAPSLRDNLSILHDSRFHLARLQNLADALKEGFFPVRVGAFSYNGYGAATSVFYPDLLLYPFALLLNAGVSMTYVMHFIDILVNLTAAASMYLLARRVYGDRDVATCASVLYTLAIYRVTDVYVRCALGEMMAMSVLPLFALALWEVLFGDRREWPLLTVTAVLLCMCHLISTLLCALFALAFCVLFAARIVRERRLLPLLKAAGLAFLLCVFFLVPLLMYGADGVGASSIRGAMSYNRLAIGQLFLWGEGDLPIDPIDPAINPNPTELGLPLIIGTMLSLYLFVTRRDTGKAMRRTLALTALGVAVALMTTTVFPWFPIKRLTHDLSDYLQFPWRFLMFVDVFLALSAAYGYVRFAGQRREAAAVVALAFSFLIALPTLNVNARLNTYLQFGQGAGSSITYHEYQLEGTNVKPYLDPNVIATEGVAVRDYARDGTTREVHVTAEQDGSVSLPLFGFMGYAAELSGERVEWTRGDNNRLTVAVPAGTDADLRVWFEGVPLWRAFDALSLASLAGLAALLVWRRRKGVPFLPPPPNESEDGQAAES